MSFLEEHQGGISDEYRHACTAKSQYLAEYRRRYVCEQSSALYTMLAGAIYAGPGYVWFFAVNEYFWLSFVFACVTFLLRDWSDREVEAQVEMASIIYEEFENGIEDLEFGDLLHYVPEEQRAAMTELVSSYPTIAVIVDYLAVNEEISEILCISWAADNNSPTHVFSAPVYKAHAEITGG